MSQLEEVWICNNSLSMLPESIGGNDTLPGWTNVVEIILTKNKGLKKLPEGIKRLTNLRLLNVEMTKVVKEHHIQLLYVQAAVRGGKEPKKKKK